MGLENDKINISTQKGCHECWGSGVKEIEPFYYIACIWCQGTGTQKKGGKNNGKEESK